MSLTEDLPHTADLDGSRVVDPLRLWFVQLT
jgi:hypothetical protein